MDRGACAYAHQAHIRADLAIVSSNDGDLLFRTRQIQKCAIIDTFAGCVRPVLTTFCDATTARVFDEAFFAGLGCVPATG
jgi:hypothetical protein